MQGIVLLFLIFVEICFVPYNVVYFEESSMGCLEECILCCYNTEFSIDICHVHLTYGVFHFQNFLIFCLDGLCIGDRQVLNSLTTTALESICDLSPLLYF
jgi:hypothetical protein